MNFMKNHPALHLAVAIVLGCGGLVICFYSGTRIAAHTIAANAARPTAHPVTQPVTPTPAANTAPAPSVYTPPPVAPAPVKFAADPDNALQANSPGGVNALISTRHGAEQYGGKTFRIRGRVTAIGSDYIVFYSYPKPFYDVYLHIDGFGDKELDSLKEKDYVEVICRFTGFGRTTSIATDNFEAYTWYFNGIELHKVAP